MTKQSNHLFSMEDAEFVEVGSHPLRGSGLSDGQSRAIYDAIVGTSNTLFPGSPGQTFTGGLVVSGIAGPTLQTYYMRHKQVIDGYFSKVNMKKLGDAIGPGVDDGVKSGLTGGGLLLGLGIGFVVAKVLSR